MTEKQLKKILQEHPHIIDSAFVRSRSGAMCLARESNVTIEEFIERAKVRSALPLATWDVFTEALARQRTHDLQKNDVIKPNILLPITSMPRFMRRTVPECA